MKKARNLILTLVVLITISFGFFGTINIQAKAEETDDALHTQTKIYKTTDSDYISGYEVYSNYANMLPRITE